MTQDLHPITDEVLRRCRRAGEDFFALEAEDVAAIEKRLLSISDAEEQEDAVSSLVCLGRHLEQEAEGGESARQIMALGAVYPEIFVRWMIAVQQSAEEQFEDSAKNFAQKFGSAVPKLSGCGTSAASSGKSMMDILSSQLVAG